MDQGPWIGINPHHQRPGTWARPFARQSWFSKQELGCTCSLTSPARSCASSSLLLSSSWSLLSSTSSLCTCHYCHNHFKQPCCDHPANDLLVFPPTVARNWLTHTGKENVENAITIIVMIVNYCSKLSDPSQVPQPKLRNDFQVSWRIWLDWPTLWMRTWQVPCGAITLFHSSGNGVKTCRWVSTQVDCSHCPSQHPVNAIVNLDSIDSQFWFHG